MLAIPANVGEAFQRGPQADRGSQRSGLQITPIPLPDLPAFQSPASPSLSHTATRVLHSCQVPLCIPVLPPSSKPVAAGRELHLASPPATQKKSKNRKVHNEPNPTNEHPAPRLFSELRPSCPSFLKKCKRAPVSETNTSLVTFRRVRHSASVVGAVRSAPKSGWPEPLK